MYQILADNTLIYDSTLDDYKLGKGVISLETNKSGSFTFSIYPDHFYYDSFVRLKTIITVYKGGKIVFRGRILNDVTDYWNNKVITCEGELGFLQDSVIRPYVFSGGPSELFTKIISEHNNQVDDFKRFNIGIVTVKDDNDYITRSNSEYETAFDNLNGKLVGASLGGYLYITHGDDGTDPTPTINYIDDFSHVSTQSIEFGSNLKNYTKTVTATDIATAIIPVGAEIDDGGESAIPRRVTIENVNNGVDYIYDEKAVELRGWIFKTVTWDDVTLDTNLKRKAEEYLRDSINQTISLEIGAIDLHLIDPTIESINLGDYVRVYSTPHNFNETMLCMKQTLDLLKPENDSLVFGHTYKRFTDVQSTVARNIVQITSTYATKSALANSIVIMQDELKKSETKILENVKSMISVEDTRILAIVEGTYGSAETLTAALELKLGRNEYDEVVSMINASADTITLNSNRLIINSDNFNLTANGRITAKAGYIAEYEIISDGIKRYYEDVNLNYTSHLAANSLQFKVEANGSGVYSGEYWSMLRPEGLVITNNGTGADGPLTLMTVNYNGTYYMVRLNPDTKTLEIM